MKTETEEDKALTTTKTDKADLAKKYARTHQIFSLVETLVFVSVILILIFTGLSLRIESFAFEITSNNYLALLVFFAIIGIAEGIISFPLGYYSDYYLEHRYGLSNQSLKGYFTEKMKGLALGIILGVPLLLAFYYILMTFGDNWWLILGVFMFFVSVILGRITPTIIMPLFYKFKPLENDELKSAILDLCRKTGVHVKGIYTFNMSKDTKKANAAFTGMGRTKRIILGDTLVENFSKEEIEMVFSHEMGHYKKNHIIKIITVSTILTFAGLYITANLYEASLGYFGFSGISEIAAIPLLFLYLSIYGLITSPVSNIFSRKFEWEADTFALETTKNKPAFISAMEKLADQNLAEKSPNKVIEFLFHSHPSIEKRIQFAEKFSF